MQKIGLSERSFMLLRTVILCLVAMPVTALGQVHSLTLGIDVNSPYGLSEPWFTIRNALLRLNDLDTVAERPDVKAGTGQVRTKGSRLPDIAKLQRAISESGAGATLRGVEATIDGELVRRDSHWLLRTPEKEVPLIALTQPVQQERKRTRTATPEESGAFQRLTQEANSGKRWRVTGPLRSHAKLALEVRNFEQVKN